MCLGSCTAGSWITSSHARRAGSVRSARSVCHSTLKPLSWALWSTFNDARTPRGHHDVGRAAYWILRGCDAKEDPSTIHTWGLVARATESQPRDAFNNMSKIIRAVSFTLFVSAAWFSAATNVRADECTEFMTAHCSYFVVGLGFGFTCDEETSCTDVSGCCEFFCDGSAHFECDSQGGGNAEGFCACN